MGYERRLYTHLGWLCFLAALLVACGGPRPAPQSGASPTPGEALRRDAQEYARLFGVSEEEALQRMQYQDGIGELGSALETNEADTFGGLWIEHEPAYRIVVCFTRDGEKTLRSYLEGKSFAHLVEVRQVRYTLAELQSIQAQALRELEKLDFGVNVLLDVKNNRVEVPVSERAWFEGELSRVGAQLPAGVELVVVEGGSTARDKDLLLTPPVPGIAFPRQKPVEGMRTSMLAELVGTLVLDADGGCLRVAPLYGGESLLPIWPPEYTLRVEGEQVLVIDGEGQVAARVGEEVSMSGGQVAVTDEWVLQQIPTACRGAYFVVGHEVRPSLRHDSSLFSLDVISTTTRTLLFLHVKPALDEQVTEAQSIAGKLVAYDYRRCIHLQTEWGPGSVMLLWPADWSLHVEGDTATILDGAGQAAVQLGDEVRLCVRAIPQTMESPIYRQLLDELPGDCTGTTWIVDGVE